MNIPYQGTHTRPHARACQRVGRKSARGFSLVSAIFLIVVIAVIGAAMVTIGSVQQQTSVLSVLSSRALFAAESGINWAIHSVLSNGDCSAFPANFNLNGGAASGFNLALTCDLGGSPYTEVPDTFNVYRLTSIATLGSVGDPDYISRSLGAVVTDAP